MFKPDNIYHIVPYYSQLPSFLQKEGSLTSKQINKWEKKLCGLLCAYMVLGAFKNQSHSIAEFLDVANEIDAYDQDKGWIHNKLIQLLKRYGISGERLSISNVDKVYKFLMDGKLIITSVSPHYRNSSFNFLRREKSGHLVLIIGVKKSVTNEFDFIIHDPGSEFFSGRPSVLVNKKQFQKKFSGNIMIFEKK